MSIILVNGSQAKDMLRRRALISELVARGHQVHLSAPAIDDDARRAFAAVGATAHDVALSRTGGNVVADVRYVRSLQRLVARLSPDYVLGFTIKPNVWGTLAGSAAGVRCGMVVTGLGYSFFEARGTRQRAVKTIAQWLYRQAAARAHRIAFQNSDDLADFIAAGCLDDQSRAFLINGSGVDVIHFQPRPLPDEPVFLMLTRMLGGKGITDFVAAAPIVRQAVPSARFLIGGPFEDGPDALPRSELKAWAASGVDYIGESEDVRPEIARSAVFVLPSWREGTSRAVLEAMAMGRPIVTTDAPGCRATVDDGVNGRLVPVRDPPRLAAAMIELARDPALRRAMGAQSRRIAEQKFAVDEVNASLLERLGL